MREDDSLQSNKQVIKLRQYNIYHNYPAEYCIIDSLQDRIMFMEIGQADIRLVICLEEQKLTFYQKYGVVVSYLGNNTFEVEVEEYD